VEGKGAMIVFTRLTPSVLVAEAVDPAAEAAAAERRFAALRMWRPTIVEAERRAQIASRLDAALAATPRRS